MRRAQAQAIINALGDFSVGDFVIHLLSDPGLSGSPVRLSFIQQWPELQEWALSTDPLARATDNFITTTITQKLTAETAHLANKESGWHFSARNASAEKVHAFSIQGMADQLERQAPLLWGLLGELLQSDPALARRRSQYWEPQVQEPVQVTEEWDDEAEYWAEDAFTESLVEEEPTEGAQGGRPTKRQRRAAERIQSLYRIVSFSFLMSVLYRTDFENRDA